MCLNQKLWRSQYAMSELRKLCSLVSFFFLQVLSDFIESIYAFGLLVTAFTVQITAIVLLFTPLLFLVFRKSPSRSFVIGISYLAILTRLLEPMLSPGGKLVAIMRDFFFPILHASQQGTVLKKQWKSKWH
jgi:hypothetical protein